MRNLTSLGQYAGGQPQYGGGGYTYEQDPAGPSYGEQRRRDLERQYEEDNVGDYLFPKIHGEDDQARISRSAYQYGGSPGGFQQQAGGYTQLGNEAQGRSAYQMDPTQQNQARGYQNLAAGSYIDTLRGRTPSLAEMQMRQGLAQNNAAASGMAASARGGGANLAAAQRMAMRQQGMNSSQTSADAAMLRAREQDMARQGLAGVGGQMRGQDIGWQEGQGRLEMGQRGLNDARSQGMYGMANDVYSKQLEANMQRERLNYEAQQAQRNNNLDIQKTNTAQANDTTGGFLNAAGKVIGGIFSDENLKKDIGEEGNPYPQGNPYYNAPDDMSWAARDMATNPYAQPAHPQSKFGEAYKKLDESLKKDAESRKKNEESKGSATYKGLGSFGEGLGSMFSDENLKCGISKASSLDMADKLEPKSYRYKWEDESEPKRVGVMAQDMEKSRAGSSAVRDTPDGKVIDVNRGLSLALASVAALKDEVDSLKRGRK